MKITTTGSQIPLPTWEKIRIFQSGGIGQRTDACPDHDQNGIEPVEYGGVFEFVVEPASKAKPLANHVRGVESGQNGSGERAMR